MNKVKLTLLIADVVCWLLITWVLLSVGYITVAAFTASFGIVYTYRAIECYMKLKDLEN